MQLSQNDGPYVRRVRPKSDEPLIIEHTTGDTTTIQPDDWEIDREHHRLYLNVDSITNPTPPVSVHIPLGTLNGDNQAKKVESTARAILPILRYSTVSEISADEYTSHEFDAPLVELWLGQTEESNPIWTKGSIERLLP